MLSTSKLFYNPSAGGATDPYFKYVPLLLETTSTNGQQNNTFLDSSTNNFTITRNGTPTQGSVNPYWPNGYWSNFNPDSDNGIGVATSAALNMGTGNFTVEAWVNTAKLPTTNAFQTSSGGYQCVFGTGPNSSSTGSQLYIGVTNLFFDIASDGSGPISVAHNMVAGQWYHVAITRNGTTFQAFINGALVQTATSSSSWVDGYNYGIMRGEPIGGFGGAWWYGYVSNFRIVKGVVVYTGAFTVPTSPLAATQSAGTNISAITGTQTSLLTCQSNRFKDNSTNAFAITANGTPKVQAFQPFSPPASYTAAAYGGSGYFNGSSDYLTVADNAAFQPGSGDFTFEAWIYPLSLPAAGVYKNIWSQRTTSSLYGGASATIDSTGTFVYFIANSAGNAWQSGGTSSGLSATLNAWQHIALVRSGNTVTIYKNGVAGTPITVATGLVQYFGNLALMAGAADGSQKLDGYISNFRMVKGTAVYTTSFTPPTSPVTAIANTGLLTNFTNAGIYDATTQNNQITVGSAQASTTITAKWPPTSMKFNGTTDYLTAIDGTQLQLGTGDFTIEGWVYLAANGVAYGIISKGTATTGWSVNVTVLNKLQFSYTASVLTGTTSLATSTWYYFAVVRSGSATGNLKLYLNGSLEATSGGAVTDNFNQTNTLYVGADRIGTSLLSGYLQDIRITKYARTITTPTAAFPTR